MKQIWTVLGHVYLVTCRSDLWNRLFRHLSYSVFRTHNIGNRKLWGSSFFSKYSKFQLDFKNWARNWEKVYFLRQLLRNWYREIASIRNRTLFIGSQYVNKQTQNLACQSERIFPTQLTWQWPMNMIKVMWCIFQQCLGTFTMLFLEGSSEMGLFRHLSDYVLGVRNFENTKCMRVIFFFKIFKI